MRSLLLPIWALLLCLVAPSLAGAQDVYFSMGNEIRKLTLGSPGSSLVHTSPGPVGDLAFCAGDPDPSPISAGRQYLYFVEGSWISRLDVNTGLGKKASVNTSAAQVFTPTLPAPAVREIRLNKDCDLTFATSSGVFQLDGTPTPTPATSATQIATASASGLAFAYDGTLRYSDGAAVKSLPSGFTGTAPAAVVGLGVANGGQGSQLDVLGNGLGVLDLKAVCASTGNTIKCGPNTGGTLGTTLATFSQTGLKAQYFEFLTNDLAVAAASVNPAAAIGGSGVTFNGFLYLVSASGITELAKGPKVSGQYVPIVGVAVGPSNSQAVTTSGTTHSVSFGPVTFDVLTPQSCSLSIQLRQLSWAQAQDKLDLVPGPNDYLLDPGFGGESWIDDVIVEGNPVDCGMSLDNLATLGMGQFNDNKANGALVKCDGNTCKVITDSNFPFSSPDDSYRGGGADDFSDFLTAIIFTDPQPIKFNSPLNNGAQVQGVITPAAIAAASTHNLSGGFSIRFRICANTDCTLFLPAEQSNFPATGAGLSITRLDAAGLALADCDIDDQGGANPDRPIFRASDSVTHMFNLNTPMESRNPPTGADPCSQAGLYVANVFSNSGAFTPTAILFRLQ